MENNKSENLIYLIDEENKKCADCKCLNPTFISVNNGITICLNCSKIHSKLGNSISFIKKIDDKLDSYILSFFTLGSNSKFHKMIGKLKINNKLPIEIKYKTYGLDYYRRILKAKVLGQKLFDVDFEEPNKVKDNIENNYPEFENYKLKVEDINLIYNKKNNNKKFLDKFQFFGNKKENQNLKEKIKKSSSNVENNIKQTIKKTGNIVIEKSQTKTSQIKKGVNYIGNQFKGVYEGIKGKIIKTKSQENIKIDFKINDENKNNNNKNNFNDIKGEMINNPLSIIMKNNYEKENENENEENNNFNIETNHNLLVDEVHKSKILL